MEWLLAFALGILCAWLLLRSLKWLPLVACGLLLGRECEGGSNFHTTTACGSCNQGFYNLTQSAQVNFSSGAGGAPPGGCGINAGNSSWNGNSLIWTLNGVGVGSAFTYTDNSTYTCDCSGNNVPVAPVYYGNYCVTNDTGHPGTWKFSDNCGYSQSQNLAPGTSWCVTYSNTNLSCFPVGFSWTGWDGSGISWGPLEPPDGTNSPPGSPTGIPSPSPGAGGPSPSGGPSGTNGATGGDLGKLQTNLTTVINIDLTWLGNVIGGNQALQLAQGTGMSNRLSDLQGNMIVLTNELGPTNLQSPYLSYLTNQSKLSAVTNLLSALLTNNLNTNLDNPFGSNRFLAMQAWDTNPVGVAWGQASLSNAGWGWQGVGSNAVSTGALSFFASVNVNGITNMSIPASNPDLWRIGIVTNVSIAASGGYAVGNIDANPLHQGFFVASAAWVRIINYWVLLWFYCIWAYDLFNKRITYLCLIKSENFNSESGWVTSAARIAFWCTLVVGYPAAVWATLGSIMTWPASSGPAVSVFSGSTLAGFGSYGSLFGEALAMVDTFVPLEFAGVVTVMSLAVRVGVDSIWTWVAIKLKWS